MVEYSIAYKDSEYLKCGMIVSNKYVKTELSDLFESVFNIDDETKRKAYDMTHKDTIPLNGKGVLIKEYKNLFKAVYVGNKKNKKVFKANGAFYRSKDIDGNRPSIFGKYIILPKT